MTDKKARLASLQTLFETRHGTVVQLPPRLARRYGSLRIPSKRGHPHVFSNFVTTLDGVVSFNSPGHASGGDISGSGTVDLRLPIFASGKVCALILTTTAGERRLRREAASDSVEIRAIGTSRRAISARAILDEVCRMRSNRLILVEGGPRLLGDFYAECLIDEQFLTIAPQVAGRNDGNRRPSLVTGKTFAPGNAHWGTLTDARRGGSHLFLRYSFSGSGLAREPEVVGQPSLPEDE